MEALDHRVLAIEVRAAHTIDDQDVTHLKWPKSKLGTELLDAVVVSTGPYAYRRPDGIAVALPHFSDRSKMTAAAPAARQPMTR